MKSRAIIEALVRMATAVEANKDLLCELDSAAGDGDHGVSMTIGMRAARRDLALLKDPTPEQALKAVSDAFGDEVGASSGVLYEMGFAAAAEAVKGRDSLETARDWSLVVGAIAQSVQEVGGARPGDKTMLDAWLPAARALSKAADDGLGAPAALAAAAEAARRGVEDTRNLIPKRGRASLLGERARGHTDPGAMSAYLMIAALKDSAQAS